MFPSVRVVRLWPLIILATAVAGHASSLYRITDAQFSRNLELPPELSKPYQVQNAAAYAELEAHEIRMISQAGRSVVTIFPQDGNGSGVILSPDGYIVTLLHVIDDASKVLVKLADEREFTAVVVGTDPRSDIAVLKIPADGLPAAQWADSKSLSLGQRVVAIGAPFELGNSVTRGIVSGLNRPGLQQADDEAHIRQNIIHTDLIQTDAAINPGNSGGGLFTLSDGKLIGINWFITTYRTNPANSGVGFAIPARRVLKVASQLILDGRMPPRGILGADARELTPRLKQEYNILPEHRGVLLVEVGQDGPAGKAGLKVGDLIIEFHGQSVAHAGDVRDILDALAPGSPVKASVLRHNERLDFTITLGAP